MEVKFFLERGDDFFFFFFLERVGVRDVRIKRRGLEKEKEGEGEFIRERKGGQLEKK